MTETSIDETLSLLYDHKQEYEDIAIDIKRQTLELEKSFVVLMMGFAIAYMILT